MSNKARRYTMPLLTCAVLLAASGAHALDWSLWKKKASQTRTQKELASARTLAISAFTGGTGATASRKLAEQLAGVQGITVLDKAARFILSGKSEAGRLDATLSERGGKTLFERTYAAPGIADNVKALADDVLFVVTGKQGLASSQITFVSDLSGTKQIYVCDADGSNIERVTNHQHGAVSPAISPDFLAYTGYATGFSSVILVDLGGGSERRIASTPGLNSGVAFAPDGRRVALTMSFVGNPEIFVMDLMTSHAVCVTESVGTPSSPSWHPDGQRIIFSSNEGEGPQLYVVESDTENPAVHWACGYRFATEPEWSPDGKQVTFTVRLGNDFAVATRPYPAGRSKIVQHNAQHSTWSPDGGSLAYVQNGQLWIQDLSNGQRRSVVSGRGEISEPRWMR